MFGSLPFILMLTADWLGAHVSIPFMEAQNCQIRNYPTGKEFYISFRFSDNYEWGLLSFAPDYLVEGNTLGP